MWRDVAGNRRPVIEHWDRWDVMSREEQAARLALRISLLRRRQYQSGRVVYVEELEAAQRRYDALSNGAVIPLEVLNADRGVGEQLALL